MRLINRVFKPARSSSRQVAKERLQLVLVHDRTQISPQLLQTLKDEIIAVISRHVAIELFFRRGFLSNSFWNSGIRWSV